LDFKGLNAYLKTFCEKSGKRTAGDRLFHVVALLTAKFRCPVGSLSIWTQTADAVDMRKNPYDITHLTLGMLPHYLGKLQIQIF